jgi:hypothetical protein
MVRRKRKELKRVEERRMKREKEKIRMDNDCFEFRVNLLIMLSLIWSNAYHELGIALYAWPCMSYALHSALGRIQGS